MNSLTHRYVALRIQEKLKQEFGISLPKRRLVWGSTRPDFIPNPISHYKDEKMYLFYEKWDRLRKINPSRQMDTFTLELGQIFHFICDYFCYAHNNQELVNRLWMHMKYEQYLHSVAKRQSPEFFNLSYANYSMISFRELIEYKHKLYLSQPQSFENDLKSSFEVCMITARKLFENSAITPTYKKIG